MDGSFCNADTTFAVIAPLPRSGMATSRLVTLQAWQPSFTALLNPLATAASHGNSGTPTASTWPAALETWMNQLPRIAPLRVAYSLLDGLAMIVASSGTSPVNDGIRATPAFLYSATFWDQRA